MKPLGGWECLTPWPNKLIQSLIKRRFLSDRIKCASSSQGCLVVTHPPLGNDQALFIESKIRHKISPCYIPEMEDMPFLIFNYWLGCSQCIKTYKVGCPYNMVQYIMSFYLLYCTAMTTAEPKLPFNSQKTPHPSLWWASYAVSFVRSWEKIDHVITASHCIFLYFLFLLSFIQTKHSKSPRVHKGPVQWGFITKWSIMISHTPWYLYDRSYFDLTKDIPLLWCFYCEYFTENLTGPCSNHPRWELSSIPDYPPHNTVPRDQYELYP